jgi:hypothetical protein
MKKTLILSLLIGLFGCQAQQTDIITEIHRPDGSIERYVNKSSGYGYNPNVTGNVNVGGVQGANNVSINNSYGGYYYNYHRPFVYTTPGAVPIPVNLNVYDYNPVINWNGHYYPARRY